MGALQVHCGGEPAPRVAASATTASARAEGVGGGVLAPPSWSVDADDELALRRLAHEQGATELLLALRSPSHRSAALAALRFAEDRELSILPLAQLASSDLQSASYLSALEEVLATPGSDRERLAVDEERQAFGILLGLAHDAKRAQPERASAVTCLGRLRERGVGSQAELLQARQALP